MSTLFQDFPLSLGIQGSVAATEEEAEKEDNQYHIFAVAQFPRAEEDGHCEPQITPYQCDGGTNAAAHWRPQNPSPRRDGLCILLGSEHRVWLEIQIAQHKGMTYIGQATPVFQVLPYRGVK